MGQEDENLTVRFLLVSLVPFSVWTFIMSRAGDIPDPYSLIFNFFDIFIPLTYEFYRHLGSLL